MKRNIYLSRMIRPRLKSAIIIASAVLFLLYLTVSPQDLSAQVYYYINPSKGISCYRLDVDRLPDLSTAEIRPGKSIFFHETSCRSVQEGKITILPRQACAVESAARQNPNLDVYLTFSSPGIFKFEGSESDKILQKLLEYPNLKIHHLNFENYINNTPLETIYFRGDLEHSSFSQSHASDILRYLTLYKYGGIYLDTDVLVIKSLEGLKPNYAGIESDTNVAAGVISFDHQGVGHQHAASCVYDLMTNFQRHSWGANGPGVITRLLRKLCKVELGREMLHKNCENFTVYPKSYFYPVRWEDWKFYFDEGRLEEVHALARESYVLHVWNKHSETTKVPVDAQVAYAVYAQKFCPKVFKQCDSFF